MFVTALEKDPSHKAARYYLGLMYQQVGQYSNARQEMTTVLEVEKNDRLVYESRGLIY